MRTNSPEHFGHLVVDLLTEISLERRLRSIAADPRNCRDRQLTRMQEISAMAQHLGCAHVAMLLFEARELLRAHAVIVDLPWGEGGLADVPPWDEQPGHPQAESVCDGRSVERSEGQNPRARQDQQIIELTVDRDQSTGSGRGFAT